MQAVQPARGNGWVIGGRYRVLDRVGSGGMAEVFRAHDELLDRDVAVKVFRTLLDDPDGTANGAARRELELQAMARLNHPNLITLYDGSVAGDGPSYLVLEFVDGPDLASRLKEGPLPESQVREAGAQIADALAYVHAHGLVHRDVKPANILLGREDGPVERLRARLSDFGIVRMVGHPQVTSADLTIGTAYYLAPEQARGSAVGPEADVYALGLVLLEALTGSRAFDGPMHEALAARLARDPEVPTDLPKPWPALLAGMTSQDPAARPTAAEVAHQLQTTGVLPVGVADAGATMPIAVLPPATSAAAAVPAAAGTVAALAAPAAESPGPPPVRRRRRMHPGIVLATLLLAAAVAVAAFVLRSDPTGAPAGPEPTTPVTTRTNAPTSHLRTTTRPAPAAEINTQPSERHTREQRATTSRAPSPSPTRSRSSSSAPPTTSSAPPSSTSAPPTTSSAPSTTSSAPTSTASTSTSDAGVGPDDERGSSTSTGP